MIINVSFPRQHALVSFMLGRLLLVCSTLSVLVYGNCLLLPAEHLLHGWQLESLLVLLEDSPLHQRLVALPEQHIHVVLVLLKQRLLLRSVVLHRT